MPTRSAALPTTVSRSVFFALRIAIQTSAILIGVFSCRRGIELPGRDERVPAVVVVDAQSSGQVSGEKEIEPNDRPSLAQKLLPAKALSGVLNPRRPCVSGIKSRPAAGACGKPDRDFYRIAVEKPGILRVNVATLSEVDFAIRVFRADDSAARRRVAIIRVDNEKSGGETLPNLRVDQGTYFIEISAKRSSVVRTRAGRVLGKYRLTYQIRDESGTLEEAEPNADRFVASAMTEEGEVLGFCGAQGDVDWFGIPLWKPAPEIVAAEVEGIDGLVLSLAVVRSDGYVVQVRRSRIGRGVRLSNLPLSVLGVSGSPADKRSDTDPAFYLRVRCLRSFNPLLPYTLRVFFSARPTPDLEEEPNDSASQATLVGNRGRSTGTIADPSDRDFFRIDVARPTPVTIRLHAASASKLVVEEMGWNVGNKAVFLKTMRAGTVVVARPPFFMISVRTTRRSPLDAHQSHYTMQVSRVENKNIIK